MQHRRLSLIVFRRKALSWAALAAAAFPSQSNAIDSNNIFSLGIEGFHDSYTEIDAGGVYDETNYGSITGHASHDFGRLFLALDGRVSYGEDSYKSDTGTLKGEPQWEYEARLRGGASFHILGGTVSPYLGMGLRYFEDEGKGGVTDTGYNAYDRRITQLYVPLGITYSHTTDGGWTLAPNLEVDPLLWGNVNTRLTNFGGSNENNTQDSGVGLRGEFMVGRDEGPIAWQIGPFFRYWDIQTSQQGGYAGTNSAGQPLYYYEPHNERLQVGGALRILW